MSAFLYQKAKEVMNESDKDRIICLYFALLAQGSKPNGAAYEQAAVDMKSTKRSMEVQMSSLFQKLRKHDCFFDEGAVGGVQTATAPPKSKGGKRKAASAEVEGAEPKLLKKISRGEKDSVASVKEKMVEDVDDEI